MSTVDEKSFKICNVLGGLDVTRFVSSNTRQLFQGAIEDVELIREYVSQAATNHGIVGGLSNLQQMSHTLQWKEREFEKEITTVEAGLAYVDDRSERIVDRYVSHHNAEKPLVGDRETDMKIVDTVTNLFPWLVDRKSIEAQWWIDHQNGRSEGPEKAPFLFDSLYAAAWIGSYGNAWVYYPPFRVFGEGHPTTMGDVLGDEIESHDLPFVKPNLPQNNPGRKAFLGAPYPDTARPGLSLITAMAPIYFTGTFGNYTYNDTYIASTGVDIAVDSTSSLLDILLDRLTASSFAILVDTDFRSIVISQAVVERIYPSRTGFEESRVTYNQGVNGSILEDRRNQTYLVSDTIHEDLTKLNNANWSELLRTVRQVRRGDRAFSKLNVTLTGDEQPVEFYVMYERWRDVADWVLMAFAPTNNVEHAIDVGIYGSVSHQNDSSIELKGERGHELFGEAILINKGTLDVVVTPESTPSWFELFPTELDKLTIVSGGTLPLQFNVDTSKLEFGVSSFLLAFAIQDDDYSDCFYNQDISLAVTIKVTPKDCVAFTGDPMRVADAEGNCMCVPAAVDIWGICCRYAVLLPAILIPLIFLGLVAVHFYVEHTRKRADCIWSIKTSDLKFDDPPRILGRGTFGLVVLAEYRGTQVAVKRVIPPRIQQPDKSSDSLFQSKRMSTIMEIKNKSTTMSIRSSTYFDFNHAINSTLTESIEFSKLKDEFVSEMRLLSKLRHPCITTVMGAVVSGWEEPLLVMELMDHGSLFDILHNETIFVEGDVVLPILRDISQGLRFLHAATPQVIHGDLKAQNVLVDDRFRAKVADFGLSQKKHAGAAGTPFWMAPELLRRESFNTAASDVYSFGIILYEVYSRKVPYEGKDFEETIEQICDPYINKRPPIPGSMPSEVVALMTACTQARPDLRPTFREIDDKLKLFYVGTVEPRENNFSMQAKKSLNAQLTATENLLLEMFPKHVADALSKGQKVVPQHFDCVTIFFSDIVGFTRIASESTPMKISDMLDRLYTKFDKLSREHDVFKVETIGDAWMGVTNVVTPQPDHTKRIAAFAIDAIKAAGITLIDQEDRSKGFVNIRVGFHSGPVIANVVGSRNPKYTLIGDTVNTSARMESNSIPGCILCSVPAAKLLREQAPDFSITPRAKIEVKGKGSMETFWVTRRAEQNGQERLHNSTEISPLLP